MSLLALVSAGVAAACLTLAAIHFGIWWRDRSALANLGFIVLAVGVSLFALSEMYLMRADTAVRFVEAMRWTQISIFLMVVGCVAFVRFYMRTARAWIGHLAWLVRLAVLVIQLIWVPGIDYDVIAAMHPVSFLGETVFVAEGVTSVWHWVGQASHVLVLALVVDASWRLWREGSPAGRRKALMIGVPTSAFVLLAGGYAGLIFAGIVRWPHLEFVAFLGLLSAMSFELSTDVLRSTRLARDLQVTVAELEKAERDAHRLSGRLIHAQEDERRRIARELHDDLNQRLALLSVELELLARTPTADHGAGRAVELAARVRELSSRVHELSYQLHPAKLEQLGLVTASRSWCEDVMEHSALDVVFVSDHVPDHVSADQALALFRILQEALRNVVRHSGATTAQVRLSGQADQLRLSVTDNGQGFSPRESSRVAGLGIVSMQERVRLLNGTIAVQSQTGVGTSVDVSVPLGGAS